MIGLLSLIKTCRCYHAANNVDDSSKAALHIYKYCQPRDEGLTLFVSPPPP